MEIWSPCERVGKPLIGSNHMHSMACREGDETSMLVERRYTWLLATTIERRDVMALVSERLQPTVGKVGDDDSALIGDAHSMREIELAWLMALRAELEQERAIDQRQYLHSMIAGITDDDSMSIMIDRDACWRRELARLRSFVADREQEREIDRRQEHQSTVVGVDDDDAMMMLVDRKALRIVKLESSRSILADARQERLVAQRP